ncbi:KpsF/GutQ family sugar-phosphate isomerase [Marinigracilibium pacificum]|uniref:KpsF/GutQ family sugar-phosphate isomerase n=1 Tax=Marinigracilibium pacificum TaxID=2729599 RepID=A0A848J2S3_9BACT|nr:KpsF/GutQ family sugar-phosphate isomerase [Marinigracilibium pacificum]NMM48840.1 KpsF/GutQ family sugar-phosphate isomerase [Marinigracilibium pacificum]
MNLAKNIKLIAKNVLLNEAEAIKNIAGFIDDEFEAIVKAIITTKGRVVITGIGKSAIIANKIVATMNSTGTPALFMHAADAIHGDLGMIQPEDIVICISKSGNTPEIKVLVPLIKRSGCQLVGLVSNTDSFLAQQADFVLNATIGEEACPHNLAPTTSTTAHLAIGDALAVALLEAKGFTSEDFGKYHPGGALGKQLYLKVDDIYPVNEKPIVKPSTPLNECIIEISSKRLGAAVVIDDNDNIVGVITDGDLRRMLQKNPSLDGLTAADVMGANPKTIEAGEYAVTAFNVMQKNNITQIIVTNKEKFVGFVHLHDLLREGII